MATEHKRRALPNILITGTPGTGKTTTSDMLASATGLKHWELSSVIKERGLYTERDEELDCLVYDEDLVVDELEEPMCEGGNIVDFHGSDFFPERWFDLVVVLRTDNTVLYDRLIKRGYSGRKLTENIECEIMQVLLEEARESYRHEIIWELPSNTVEDMERNVAKLEEFVKQFATAHSGSGVAPMNS